MHNSTERPPPIQAELFFSQTKPSNELITLKEYITPPHYQQLLITCWKLLGLLVLGLFQ